MELLLLILKIILIALGVALGIIVLFLGLVLFVPIRYEISGSVQNEWKFDVKGTIRYLLSIFKLIFSYENGQTDTKISLFGRQMKSKTFDELASEEEAEDVSYASDADETPIQTETEEKSENVSKDENSVNEESQTYAETSSENQDFNNPDTSIHKEEAQSSVNNVTDTVNVSTPTETPRNSKNNKRTQNRQKKKPQKEKSKFDFAWLKQELTDEHNKSVVKKCLKELKYLLVHFRFRKIKTDLVFSTGDPAYTGQALGVLCMIPALYHYEFKLIPDFESDELYLKGTFSIAGKIRLIHILIVVLRLILDKEVRLVVMKFKNQFE